LPDGCGPFDTVGYVSASANHQGAEAVFFEAGETGLWLLRSAEGGLHTVYGYPQPVGNTRDEGLAQLATELATQNHSLRIALSPLEAGMRMSWHLIGRLPVINCHDVLVADLEGDPLAGFTSTARSTVRRAERGGATVELGAVTPDFGPMYRATMEAQNAKAIYLFDDSYLAGLPAEDTFQVTVSDRHGVAAAALFLCRASQASYHLSARRDKPTAVPGTVNLAIANGLQECARRGAVVCILGGGLTPAPNDPLFKFKASMATRKVTRPTFATAT
jgi:hypothetical protein